MEPANKNLSDFATQPNSINQPNLTNRSNLSNQPRLNYWKLAVTVVLTWYFFLYATGDPTKSMANWNFLDGVDLIIHEAGHFVFVFFGQFIQVLGGSLLQILVPVVFAGYFLLRQEYFSGSLLLFWVGQNIINVSVYMNDAVLQRLPLLGGDGVIHDWNYLLSHMGLLNSTSGLANATHGLGFLFIIVAALGCLIFSLREETRDKIWNFFRSNEAPSQ